MTKLSWASSFQYRTDDLFRPTVRSAGRPAKLVIRTDFDTSKLKSHAKLGRRRSEYPFGPITSSVTKPQPALLQA